MILGNALEIRNFFFALGLIACHHILKAQVALRLRGFGLPDTGGCFAAGRAAASRACTTVTALLPLGARAAGRAGCALRCGLGLLDGQCNLAIRRDGDDLNLNGLASFQHGSKVLHKLIAYLRNVNKAGFAFRQGNEGAKRLNAGNFAFQDVSNL